jgi:RimJ/RimL family protein N-acetyltransferase
LSPPLSTLETDRLIIRPLVVDDLENCHRLRIDIGWADAQATDEVNREHRRTWLDWTIDGYREFARLHQPQYGERAIASRKDGAFLGLIGMVPCMAPFAQLPSRGGRPRARATTEVGLFWALSPGAQGQGFATEAARGLATHLFDHLNLARLVATTERDNPRSIAVMRRLGMRIETNPFTDPEYSRSSESLTRRHEAIRDETGSRLKPGVRQMRERPYRHIFPILDRPR